MRHEKADQFSGVKKHFGGWLVDQAHRDDNVGELARFAAADRRFPRTGDVKAVWAYINAQQPEGDIFLALEDAELDWLAL